MLPYQTARILFMPNHAAASFDLLVLLWKRWKTLALFIVVISAIGVGASLFLPAQHRAKATLVPVSEGQAAELFPVTVPESILQGDSKAFAPDSGELFDRILVSLSAVASARSEDESPEGKDATDFRLNYTDKDGRRFVELTVSAPSVENALPGLQAWTAKAEQEALSDLDSEFTSLVSRSLRDTEYRLDQKLIQEKNELLVQKERLQDELQLVSGLLENNALAGTNNDSFLLYPQENENLFADGLPPYLLSSDRLQARKAQLSLQLEQLDARIGGGVYLPGLADLEAQITSLKSLNENFQSWVIGRPDRSLLRFSELPAQEETSALKRTILFGAGGVMLGLLLGLVWIFLAEAVRIARERAE